MPTNSEPDQVPTVEVEDAPGVLEIFSLPVFKHLIDALDQAEHQCTPTHWRANRHIWIKNSPIPLRPGDTVQLLSPDSELPYVTAEVKGHCHLEVDAPKGKFLRVWKVFPFGNTSRKIVVEILNRNALQAPGVTFTIFD